MSLELAIQQNTAAINSLIEILSKGFSATIVSPDALEEQVLAEPEPEKAKVKRAKKEVEKVEAPLEQSAPAPASGATDASVTEAAAAPTKPATYTDAADAVTQVIKAKGTPAAKEILKAFGAEKSLKEVAPENFGAVISACQAVLV